jgi:hypothetical protein
LAAEPPTESNQCNSEQGEQEGTWLSPAIRNLDQMQDRRKEGSRNSETQCRQSARQLRKKPPAGVSQLSIDPQLGSSQQNPGARVAIRQRVTSNIFVTFSTDVTSTDSQVVQLEYQVNRKTSFSAVRDQNGGFSFETTFRKQW